MNLKVIVTGVGAPGIGGTIYSLRNNYDNRPIKIIGTDVNDDVVGKFLCDKFFVIPKPGDASKYLEAIIRICTIEEICAIIPQNTLELEVLAGNIGLFDQLGVRVLVSDVASIRKSNNKHTLLEICRLNYLLYPEYKLADNLFDLEKSFLELGWPDKKVIVKPPVSNGMRGFRIIDEQKDTRKAFYEEKPDNATISFNDLKNVLGQTFPELLITEYLPGDEYSVDIFRYKERIDVIPRKRTLIRSGITFNGNLEHNKEIIDASRILAKLLDIKFCAGFQYKMDVNNKPKILECNPRVQGTMVMSTIAGANLIYSSLKASLGEVVPDFNIDWNSCFYRYWGGVGKKGDEVFRI
jgi:carbamoyl-phosphate synthase large subunit